jgi:hypothetical protein
VQWVLSTRPRTGIAIASSIAIHVCALLIAVELVPAHFVAFDIPEAAPSADIVHIERFRPQPPHVVAPPRPPAAMRPPPERVIRSIVLPAAPRLVTHTERPVGTPHPDPERIAHQTAAISADARAAVDQAPTAGHATPLATASATPTAAPAAPTAQPLTDQGDGGLFGQNYHAMPNPPQALQAILASASMHLRLRVHIDDHGKATSVQFLTPVADAALAEALRAKILALNYVPADCNGLRCEDELDIRY